MLAKIWKKVLLAICILACMINVMYKLVSRTSLDVQLKSIQDQMDITNIWQNNEKESIEENQANENAIKKESSDNDTIVVIY